MCNLCLARGRRHKTKNSVPSLGSSAAHWDVQIARWHLLPRARGSTVWKLAGHHQKNQNRGENERSDTFRAWEPEKLKFTQFLGWFARKSQEEQLQPQRPASCEEKPVRDVDRVDISFCFSPSDWETKACAAKSVWTSVSFSQSDLCSISDSQGSLEQFLNHRDQVAVPQVFVDVGQWSSWLRLRMDSINAVLSLLLLRCILTVTQCNMHVFDVYNMSRTV